MQYLIAFVSLAYRRPVRPFNIVRAGATIRLVAVVVALLLTIYDVPSHARIARASSIAPHFTNISVAVLNGTATYYLCLADSSPPSLSGLTIAGVGGEHTAPLSFANRMCAAQGQGIEYQLTATFVGLPSGAYTFKAAIEQDYNGYLADLTPGYAFIGNNTGYTVATMCTVNFSVSPDSPTSLQSCNPVSGASGTFNGPLLPTATATATKTATAPNTATATNTATTTSTPSATATTPSATATATPSLYATANAQSATASPSPSAPSASSGMVAPLTTMTTSPTPSSSRVLPSIGQHSRRLPPPIRVTSTVFFAEGFTGGNYKEYLSLLNPRTRPVHAVVSVTRANGTQRLTVPVSLAPLERRTLIVNTILPRTSTTLRVSSDGSLVAERALYDGNGHIVAGAIPQRRWYLAEGDVGLGFVDGLRIFNPSHDLAHITLTTYSSTGVRRLAHRQVPSGVRLSVALGDIAPHGGTGIAVASSVPIVVERVVRTVTGNGPSAAMALPAPSRVWYFPDGGTTAGNQEYIALLNPDGRPTTVHLQVVTTDGYRRPVMLHLRPYMRDVFVVHRLIHDAGLAAVVMSDRPIVAQEMRYMAGALAVVNGAAQPAHTWALADGYVGHGFKEWITLLNPSSRTVRVRMKLIRQQGVLHLITVRVRPRQRAYVYVNALMPIGPVAALIEADHPVVAGRTMIYRAGASLSTTIGVAVRR